MPPPPLFTAVSSSARQLLLLLRCISFAKKALIRLSPSGLRFSTEQGSALEAFIFLDRALFTSYNYNAPAESSHQNGDNDNVASPAFEISLPSLLETLNIFSLSSDLKRPSDFESFRLARHANNNAFSNHALGFSSGLCTFTYESPGSPLSIHMTESSGITTTCDLTTYEADTTEEIPFARDALNLKTIMRAEHLLDAVNELASMSPATLTIIAAASSPSSHSGTTSTSMANLSLTASGALGSATVDFTTNTTSETPVLETFSCSAPPGPSRGGGKVSATFKFDLVKAASRAMASATKVSVRLDEEGVLSLQFLVEVEEGAGGGSGNPGGGAGAAFVDFRIVPLVEGEGEAEGELNGNEGGDSEESE